MSTPQVPPASPEAAPRPLNWRGILLVVLLFGVLPFSGLALLWKDRCKRSTVASSRSPDGTVNVEQVITDCGATMPVATEIRLAQASSPPGTPAPAATVLLVPAHDILTITWSSAQTMTIALPPKAQIAKYLSQWQGIRIDLSGERAEPKWRLPGMGLDSTVGPPRP